MSASFNPALTDSVSLVRFHIGDTNVESAFVQDETIRALYAQSEDIGQTVIACLQYIITQLSLPNFSLDWMNVSYSDARAGYEKLLKTKRAEFSIQVATATSEVKNPHRADSYEQDSEGNYEDHTGDP